MSGCVTKANQEAADPLTRQRWTAGCGGQPFFGVFSCSVSSFDLYTLCFVFSFPLLPAQSFTVGDSCVHANTSSSLRDLEGFRLFLNLSAELCVMFHARRSCHGSFFNFLRTVLFIFLLCMVGSCCCVFRAGPRASAANCMAAIQQATCAPSSYRQESTNVMG